MVTLDNPLDGPFARPADLRWRRKNGLQHRPFAIGQIIWQGEAFCANDARGWYGRIRGPRAARGISIALLFQRVLVVLGARNAGCGAMVARDQGGPLPNLPSTCSTLVGGALLCSLNDLKSPVLFVAQIGQGVADLPPEIPGQQLLFSG